MLLVSQRSSAEDGKYVKKAWTALASLKRTYPTTIHFDKEGSRVDAAQLILIFLSSEFLEEYDLFLDAIVAGPRFIPIVCRKTNLKGTPFANVTVLPNEDYRKKCLDDYGSLDAAFFPIVGKIRAIVEKSFVREVSL